MLDALKIMLDEIKYNRDINFVQIKMLVFT